MNRNHAPVRANIIESIIIESIIIVSITYAMLLSLISGNKFWYSTGLLHFILVKSHIPPCSAKLAYFPLSLSIHFIWIVERNRKSLSAEVKTISECSESAQMESSHQSYALFLVFHSSDEYNR